MGKKNKNHNTRTGEEDISFDFSFLSKLFKKSSAKKPAAKDADSGEDISIDFKSITNFISRYSVLFLLLIPLILSVYIRTVPDQLPIADRWARDSIYNNIKQNLASNILSQYPNLPQQNLVSMVNEQFNTVLSQQGPQIEAAIIQQAEGIRQRFKDPASGYTYLGDIDSYYWLRYAQNIVETGKYGDEVKDGVNYDNHMFAPEGVSAEPTLYPYIEAYLYKFLKIFNPKITLMQTAFYTPLFLSFFAIIAAFFIGKKLAGNFAGLIASVLIAVNPTILSRSLGSDNDIVNAVFPLLITLFMLYAFDSKNLKNMLINTAISGFILGIYSFAWSGWWFMFFFVIASAMAYIGYFLLFEIVNKKHSILSILKQKHFRNVALLLLLFIASTFVSLTIFGNSEKFTQSFLAPAKITQLKVASQGLNIWPNVYTTVAELNEADTGQILNGLGGALFFWIAIMGILLTLMGSNEEKNLTNIIYLAVSGIYYFIFIRFFFQNVGLYMLIALLALPFIAGLILSIGLNRKIDPTHPVMMMIWFMATIYAATKGVRFILLMMPAFAISFAAFFGFIIEYVSKALGKFLDISEAISKTILMLVALLILIQPIQSGYATAYNYVPSVNSGWVETLEKINAESKADAIINSWWDFGHWFKYFSDRAVTFDGASQNEPQAHWIGKVLLTGSEKEAISILRMLDCGGNLAFRELNQEINDTQKTVSYLYSVFGKTKPEAEKEFSSKFGAERTANLMSSLYCEPPENFFITSGDMVGKSGVWAHFGSWDFQRAKIYALYRTQDFQAFTNSLKFEFNYSDDDAKKTYYELSSFVSDRQYNDWIAGWPSYGGSASCSIKNDLLLCNVQFSGDQVIPVQINLTNKEAFIDSGETKYHPNAFGYVEGNEYLIKTYDDNQIGYGITLLQDNRTILLMSPELVGSMFTRLYYLDGVGLNNFKKFYDVTDIGGTRIITWKIDWQN